MPHPESILLGELAHVGFFQVDAERTVTAVSPELTRITGFSEEEVVGKPCLSLLRCPTCLRSCGVFEHGRIQDAHLTIFRKDGTEVAVERSGVSIRDDDGRIVGAFETVREIGGDPEADACAPPAALEAMMTGLGRMFVAVDAELNIVQMSERLPEELGRERESLVGSSIAALFGTELFGADGELRKAIDDGRRREGRRAYMETFDGARVPVSLSVGPVEGDEAGCGHPDVKAVVMLRRDSDGDSSPAPLPTYHGMVGRSPAMQRIFRLVDLLEESDSTVLVTGDSGTGKELVAKAIHESSRRADGPFVAVNCAALPSELLESELFGHVRGAFTGAVRDRAGRFEMADGGTLFLDEIGDLGPALQGKILRALQEHTFERVGDSRTRTVDVRVIAATHVDLERAVAERRFRDDLYYRLKVIPVHVPALRDRREDLPSLIAHFMERMAGRLGRSVRLSPDAGRHLLAHTWPGNVRELENALEYAITVCEGQTIHIQDLPPEIQAGATPTVPSTSSQPPAHAPGTRPGPLDLPQDELAEAARIEGALLKARYNRTAAAELLGMSRTTLWRKMREYRL
ncbi:MAG: sigma 54-interacting transcriptional regulator [Gemmatimonadetes bacterium]|nr:sigma 54-interacting transcriptional regulator [Gemmatimonadota bacterium]